MKNKADSPWLIKILVIALITVMPGVAVWNHLLGPGTYDPTGTVIVTIIMLGIGGALRLTSRNERRSHARAKEEPPAV